MEQFNYKNIEYSFKFPNKCPICKHSILPLLQGKYVNELYNHVYLLLSCPNCKKGFITGYGCEEKDYVNKKYHLFIEASHPNVPDKVIWNDNINKLSPMFCDIYNQAHSAETYELKQISGIGYRKALEFLIKDYCIYNNPNNKDKISKMPLAQVIKEYISNDKIQKLAKASVWIGNDETHYIRKFEDKDISDLKRFINATVLSIELDLTYNEALSITE